MVDTGNVTNGEVRVLPGTVTMTTLEANRIPSPGTQRALKADTGRGWDELMGEKADSADRFQTMIWMKLRRHVADLRWAECADVEIQLDTDATVDPTKLAAFGASPPSADSGG